MATIKFTVEEMFRFIGSARNVLDEKLPVKPSYRLSKLVKKIESEMKHYQEERTKLLEKHCKKDEKGKPVIEKDVYQGIEGNELFAKEHTELLSCECELDMMPVSITELGDAKISPNDMAVMDKFFIE